MRKMLILLILQVFIWPAHVFPFMTYKWVDERGILNFADDFGRVPSEYQDRVDVEVIEDAPVKTPAPSHKVEEVETDIYGQGETYWRERVRPWKERLKEAEANYEKAHKKFVESAEELSRRRYGSPTQYKFNIIELDRRRGQRVKYESQITQAKEMLEKISKEAREAGANPEWLN